MSHDVAQWFSMGLEMGLTGPGLEIEVCTFDKPSPVSKLQVIIETKFRKFGFKEKERYLLTACERIPQPIIAAVKCDCTIAGEGNGQ